MKKILAYLKYSSIILWCVISTSILSQTTNQNKFKQLHEELPTPNQYRTASGAPGSAYWQQKVDYKITIELDDNKQKISGEETITYHNNSSDPLDYLWVQLDQNMRAKDSDTHKTRTNRIGEQMSLFELKELTPNFDGGFKLKFVKNDAGKDLNYQVVKTMMRIDLPYTLKPGEKYTLQIGWWYNINNRFNLGERAEDGKRSGYEYFPEDDNYVYTIAQFFPRMAVYNDIEGWQHKQFLGRGEFTLSFGDYEVAITVPEDHYVAATGQLENADVVLSKKELDRLEKAKSARVTPVIIVTEEEAKINERTKAVEKKTWKFKAKNVRDFAFASSRKFIWDALGVELSNGEVAMAMSMYPKEGNPLWEQYSTKSVAHTLKWYSHYTFDYPYPVAWSIHTDQIGMEYPMICFNGRRPEKDRTYSERTKYGLISVIIHEVGHNFFPMIVNSDERQWTWMDEGLNSFLQYLTEQQWERAYPSRRGPADKIVDYMKGDQAYISPIMTNSESIYQFGNNAYAKPATALNILRETVMGRELFDFAFKKYAHRWMFKQPAPADFFRTMEDASGIDLDWFWRGWFYTTDHVDIAIEAVRPFRINSMNPEKESELTQLQLNNSPKYISDIRNEKSIPKTQDEIDPDIKDFYSTYNPLNVSVIDKEDYQKHLNTLTTEEKAYLEEAADHFFYEITFTNIGGLVMPIILQFEFDNGATSIHHIPAEIWRLDNHQISKVFVTDLPIKQITLDPFLETADTNLENNHFPKKTLLNKFELFRQSQQEKEPENPMQRSKRAQSTSDN